jgi:hypothetical protein
MNPLLKTIFLLGFASMVSAASFAATKLDVSQLTAVPDGNYLVTLELSGNQERLNVKVQGNRAKCVNSSGATLKGMTGEFTPHPQQNGIFAVTFRVPTGNMTQIWIFRSDGAAAIRENPDRGEQQSAVPVSGTSIDPPKAK